MTKTPDEAQVRIKNMQTRNHLWAYVRHQYSEEERPEAKQAFTFWRQNFERADTSIKLSKCPEPLEEDGKWVYDLTSVSEMRTVWEELDVDSRTQKWPLVMISTLTFCPDKAHLVLDATLNPTPPGYAIHDVLSFIARRLNLERVSIVGERVVQADAILDLVAKTLEDMPPGYVPRSQRTFGLLAKKLPAEQAKELFDILKRSGERLNVNALCNFGSKFAASDRFKEVASAILHELAHSGVDLNEPKCSSIVTTLLLSRTRTDPFLPENNVSFSPTDTLESLMETGFSPNVYNLTSLLATLCWQGEIEEAIRLSLLFAENGIKLDGEVFSTIFRGAKTSLQPDLVRKAVDVAKVSEVPYVDVLNNALHAILYFAASESRSVRQKPPWVLPVFGPMLRIYIKKFNMQPLQWWLSDSLPLILMDGWDQVGKPTPIQQHRMWEFKTTIVPIVAEFVSSDTTPTVEPDATTLTIMLRAYIKSVSASSDIWPLYEFFKSRLAESIKNNGSLPNIIQKHGSLIHDTFILAMIEQRDLFPQALEILSDMLRSSIKQRPSSKDAGAQPLHPPPSLCTFTIILRELYRRRDIDTAREIVEALRQEGLAPNLVTWNTILKGHAINQNVARTVETLQDIESNGLVPDMSTFNAFGQLQDQDRALKMMERIIEHNKEKLALEQQRALARS